MIKFQNTNYKTREIKLREFGNVLISTNSLSAKLLDEKCSYVSEEAIRVDEQIFFFVEDDEIEFPDIKLKKMLMRDII